MNFPSLFFNPLLQRSFRFVLIAGMGWVLDMLVYSMLLSLDVRAALANSVSASIGVTFSYFMSARVVFYYEGAFLMLKFVLYVLYNCVVILFFSFTIECLSIVFHVSPVVVKCLVTPVTLLTNFIMLDLLLTSRL